MSASLVNALLTDPQLQGGERRILGRPQASQRPGLALSPESANSEGRNCTSRTQVNAGSTGTLGAKGQGDCLRRANRYRSRRRSTA